MITNNCGVFGNFKKTVDSTVFLSDLIIGEMTFRLYYSEKYYAPNVKKMTWTSSFISRTLSPYCFENT